MKTKLNEVTGLDGGFHTGGNVTVVDGEAFYRVPTGPLEKKITWDKTRLSMYIEISRLISR